MSAHVFIAEDEASIVALLKYNLEKEGYKVSHSENGEDALKQIKLKQPDLILMDWMLPELSGVEIMCTAVCGARSGLGRTRHPGRTA